MSDVTYEFERFSSREGFNRSLTHFKAVSSLLSDFEGGTNLADLLNELLADKEVEQNQLGPIVYALLVDKYGYYFESFNMEETLSDLSFLPEETKKWNAVDLVLTYFHPELGLLVINPKNSQHWASVNSFKKNEVVTVYVGSFGKTAAEGDRKKYEAAAAKIMEYLHGKKSAGPALLRTGKFKYTEPKPKVVKEEAKRPAGARRPKAAASRGAGRTRPQVASAPLTFPTSAAAPSAVAAPSSATAPAAPAAAAAPATATAGTGPKRMTPFYSVPVTNELFHNGNVEAWKKVIQSYQTKYPGLEVYIFYDGERIHDIHALFKWGKVKHGSTILFSVAGENIQDVAKLQRYLRQGASPRFEDFLRFPVNTVLKLF